MRKIGVALGLLGFLVVGALSAWLVRGHSNPTGGSPRQHPPDPSAHDPRGAERPHGSLLVQVTFAPDSAPGEGVGAHILPLNGRDEILSELLLSTDAQGLIRVERIEAGRVRVMLDRGPSCDAIVVAGRQTVVRLSIPPGIDVSGLVVDAADQPVAGSEIRVQIDTRAPPRTEVWVPAGHYSELPDPRECLIATSDARGRFRLRAMAGGQRIEARSRSHAPSDARRVQERVRLELAAAPGCSLAGSVVGAGGRPVPGAAVVFLTEVLFHDKDPEHLPWIARCDPRGRFAAHGLPSGSAVLVVAAPGHAPRAVEAELVRGPMPDVEVRLEPGAALAGRATDANGIPVADAVVTVMGGARIAKARTGADGRWLVDSLPIATVAARVSSESFLAQEKTFAAPGSTDLAWNVVLETLPRIAGRVVDEAGQGLPRFSVAVCDADYPSWTRTGSTDAAGRFDIAVPTVPPRSDAVVPPLFGTPAQPGDRSPGGGTSFSLQVREPEQAFALETQGPSEVAAGETGVLLQVPDRSRATCWIEATVHDADGAPVGGAVLSVSGKYTADHLWGPGGLTSGHVRSHATSPGSGSLRAGPFPPGSYELSLVVPSPFSGRNLKRRTLRAGEVLQLGKVRVEARGTLAFSFRRADGGPPGSLAAEAKSATHETWIFLTPGDGGRGRRSLAPGAYEIEITGDSFLRFSGKFTIEAGKETRLDVALVPAVLRAIEFPLNAPEGWAESTRATWVVRDPAGREVVRRESAIRPDSPVRAELVFAAGTHSVEVSTGAGRRYAGTFEVPTLIPSHDTIRIRVERVP